MRMLLPALGVLALLAGCATEKTVVKGHVDPAAKTALVPAGGDGVLASLKYALANGGWKLRIADGELKVAATQSGDADAKAAAEGQARYTFAVDQQTFPVCAPGQTAQIGYEITVTDNKTGAEIASFKGQGAMSAGLRDKMVELVNQL
jgi:hypothetical protein